MSKSFQLMAAVPLSAFYLCRIKMCFSLSSKRCRPAFVQHGFVVQERALGQQLYGLPNCSPSKCMQCQKHALKWEVLSSKSKQLLFNSPASASSRCLWARGLCLCPVTAWQKAPNRGGKTRLRFSVQFHKHQTLQQNSAESVFDTYVETEVWRNIFSNVIKIVAKLVM